MSRLLIVAEIACFVAGAFLIFTGTPIAGLILVVVGFLIQGLLAVRAAVARVREGISEARDLYTHGRAFASGDVKRARLVELSEPRGWFNPAVRLAIEYERGDGSVHQIAEEVPVPAPWVWTYRAGRRFNVPLLSRLDPAKLLEKELRREVENVEVVRTEGETAPAQGSSSNAST